MNRRLPLLFHAIAYGLRGGFLIRPFVIALALGVVGGVLSSLEEQAPVLSAWVPTTLFPSRQDPQVAQVILSAIATSIMTVVSIVFAILLMTLTLASTQFSPRILVSFVRDRGTQWTLGVFLGTFSYCMAALPAARSQPVPFVPVLTVTGAMLLALVAVGWLIFFIHHISQAISVNHIVDRIARETELVIDDLMPRPRTRFEPLSQMALDDTGHTAILNQRSGYVRFIDVDQLLYLTVYPDSTEIRKNPLANRAWGDSGSSMIRRGFLDSESLRDLIELARDGSAAHRLARRANALVLLDKGMSCQSVAEVLLLDGDTIRSWYQLYQQDGIEGLASFGHEGGICRLTVEQQDRLKAWIAETLPRTTRAVGAWIARECGIEYQTRSGLIALLHRIGMEHRKPTAISRKLDPAKQAAFIKGYEALMNQLSADEAVIFVDAAHPTHAVRPVGCWAPKKLPVAVEQSSGRDRLNIHGAIDLETGQTIMKDVLTVDALSTIMLLMAIETMYPGMRLIHVFLDNARYHHAKLVQAWLARPDCRIRLHFVPAYCPHLNPIERLWGLMHRHTTHNKCYGSFKDFSIAMLNFLRDDVPSNWRTYCDEVTDNFRVIDPKKFRIIV